MSDVYNQSVNDLTFYTYRQVRAFHILEISASVLSVVTGLVAIMLWIRMDPSRRVIFRLQLLLTLIISDFFKALFILCFSCIRLGSFHQIAKMALDTHRFCDGWGYLREVATIYADLTILALTFHNSIMILKPQFSKIHPKTPFNFKKLMKRCWLYFLWKIEFKQIFHKNEDDIVYVNEGGVYPIRWFIVFFAVIIAFTFPALIFVHDGHYQYNFSCSAPQIPVWKGLLSSWIIRYINLVTIAIVYSTIIIYLIIYFKKIEKTKKTLYNDSNNDNNNNVSNVTNTLQKELMTLTSENNSKRRQAIMRELKTFAIYPIGYWVIWLTPTISQIHNYVDNDDPEPFVLLVFVAFMVPLSCTVDCIIFFVREKPWNCTTSAITKRANLNNMMDQDQFKPSYYTSVENTSPPHGHPHPTASLQHRHTRASIPNQLGFIQDPEIVDFNDNLDPQDKFRENSMASSNLSSNFKTLVGSKRPSVVAPNLSSVQDMDGDYSVHDSSTTNAGSSRDDDDEEEEENSVDMIDFLRGH